MLTSPDQVFRLLRSDDEEAVLAGLWKLSGLPHSTAIPMDIWKKKSDWVQSTNWEIRERTIFCFALRFPSPDACELWRDLLIITPKIESNYEILSGLLEGMKICIENGWECKDDDFDSILYDLEDWLEIALK